MNKMILLPRMAFTGIKKNGSTYFPYIISGMFSVFLFFVFASILHNDMIDSLPHSAYLSALMAIGLVLLGIILVPFLIYTNSFLIKRRKMELGLYCILGLEKKHIAIMMLFDTMIIAGAVFTGGVILGVVFSKLLFLVLINLANLPVTTGFSLSFQALRETVIFFAAVYLLNLIMNIFQVAKSNPNDLIKGTRTGEKEPKRLWITALLGVIFLAAGYIIAINAKLSSEIFLSFFLAVALVIFGTNFFFKAGIIALLKILKGNKKFYYYKLNYTTISGMLYRMRKSASSLANICIFSTMTIITLLCTISLWWGTSGILDYQFPFDMTIDFKADGLDSANALNTKLQEITDKTKAGVENKISFTYYKLPTIKKDDKFTQPKSNSRPFEQEVVRFISLSDYNQMERKNEKLSDNEVLAFSTGADFRYNHVKFGSKDYSVKKELKETVFENKSESDPFGQTFYFVVKDDGIIRDILKANGGSEKKSIYSVRFLISGDENSRKEFANQLSGWCSKQKGIDGLKNGIAGREETASMNGGLLFLGIFFGIVFSMCLILIMYYKQITEGFDDSGSFSIMQKVGMSDREVRGTIKRQILLVFFLPLLFAIFHTMAGFRIISELLGVLFLFDKTLIIAVGIIVACIFALLYGLSYFVTSKVYYRIVRQMN